jgi:hypothetical protein
VALSVVYLGLQVKAGTRATRSQTYYLATAALADMVAVIGSSEAVSRIVRTSFLRRYENVFFQHSAGLVDEDFWRGHRENLLWAYRRPGMQRVWKDRKHALSISFQEFLDRSSDIALNTPDSRRL